MENSLLLIAHMRDLHCLSILMKFKSKVYTVTVKSEKGHLELPGHNRGNKREHRIAQNP